jgi:hypothetical protein
MRNNIEEGSRKDAIIHDKYGGMLRDNIYFKQNVNEPQVIGTTVDGNPLTQTRELSKYTILKPDDTRFVIFVLQKVCELKTVI